MRVAIVTARPPTGDDMRTRHAPASRPVCARRAAGRPPHRRPRGRSAAVGVHPGPRAHVRRRARARDPRAAGRVRRERPQPRGRGLAPGGPRPDLGAPPAAREAVGPREPCAAGDGGPDRLLDGVGVDAAVAGRAVGARADARRPARGRHVVDPARRAAPGRLGGHRGALRPRPDAPHRPLDRRARRPRPGLRARRRRPVRAVARAERQRRAARGSSTASGSSGPSTTRPCTAGCGPHASSSRCRSAGPAPGSCCPPWAPARRSSPARSRSTSTPHVSRTARG